MLPNERLKLHSLSPPFEMDQNEDIDTDEDDYPELHHHHKFRYLDTIGDVLSSRD